MVIVVTIRAEVHVTVFADAQLEPSGRGGCDDHQDCEQQPADDGVLGEEQHGERVEV